MVNPMLTAERLRDVLKYDPETGAFTHRRTGKHAGTLGSHGYVLIIISRRQYKAHRLAWLYVHNRWPSKDIDHVNNVRSDNRICNLREASRLQNNANSHRYKSNRSGFKCVYWHKQRARWVSHIMIGGKRRVLGAFRNPDQAHQAYVIAARELFGEFARAE